MALKANSSGKVTGAFFIPANIPVGTKSVVFKGTNSSAQAVYRAEGWKTVNTIGQVETIVSSVAIGVDPLAETIIHLPYDVMVIGVDLWVTKLGDVSKPIIVQLRGLEGGNPSQEVFAEKSKVGDELKTDCWLPFDFDTPNLRRAGTMFSIVPMTEDADHSLAYAALGGFDNRVGKGWVPSNPFGFGTMLDGADGVTWLAHPDKDLTFRLRVVRVKEREKKFLLGVIQAEQVSDLMTFVTQARPSGTEVELEFIMPDGQRYTAAPESALELPKYYDGEITVNVTLRGTDRMTPILLPDAQVIKGTIAETANYVSRFMPAGSGSKQKVVFNAETPGNSGFSVKVQTAGTVDNPVWKDMEQAQATPLGDGLVENEFSLPVDLSETRFELTIKGGPAARPRISSLRGVTIPNII